MGENRSVIQVRDGEVEVALMGARYTNRAAAVG